MKEAVYLLFGLSAIWLMLSGFFEPLILVFGVFSVFFVLWISSRLKTTDREGVPYHLLLRLPLYLPWLLREIFRSSLDVTRRVLRPRPRLTPVLFDAPSSQKTELGRVIYANSITLTPGTVSYEVNPGSIRVHAISRGVRDDLLNGQMDRRVTKLEGES